MINDTPKLTVCLNLELINLKSSKFLVKNWYVTQFQINQKNPNGLFFVFSGFQANSSKKGSPRKPFSLPKDELRHALGSGKNQRTSS